MHTDDDVEAATAAVAAALDGAPPGAVLVKGSRGMRLERVVERLAGAR
jgi:UDP-N-acetylmuramyl pentapeptide synthase